MALYYIFLSNKNSSKNLFYRSMLYGARQGNEAIFAQIVFQISSTATLNKLPESSLFGTRRILTKLALACTHLKQPPTAISQAQRASILQALYQILTRQKSACVDVQHREYSALGSIGSMRKHGWYDI